MEQKLPRSGHHRQSHGCSGFIIWRLYDKYERARFERQEMLLINAALALVTLISSAHAGEQKATVQTDTATPIESPAAASEAVNT